jgi:hypothetical protein
MANEQNLKPFKKGQSGNPKGRPKKPDIDQYLIDALNDERNGITAIEAIIKTLISGAFRLVTNNT